MIYEIKLMCKTTFVSDLHFRYNLFQIELDITVFVCLRPCDISSHRHVQISMFFQSLSHVSSTLRAALICTH